MVEMQTFCGIAAIHKTLRQWGSKFVQSLANQIRHRLPQADGKRMASGTWAKSASRSTASRVGFGAPSIRPGWCSTFWCKAERISALSNCYFESC
jgi:hypothetical protein